ncbi:hypothetical protein [Vibrio sp. Evd11]|uniref:hypothetical protein n=1 Tax=Vibrio sp. Evd11 TaxID=1207404 RepID=UPI000EFBA537|nr:hypothetical protein [Vibrio sp. Evd11]
MPESKNDYSHLKVIRTNTYAHLLYGQDVEELHRGNSRELMLRYVKLMNFSKYLVLALAFVIYAIGAFDLGSILPASFIEYMIKNLYSVQDLYQSIESVGGDKLDLSNIILILYFLIIPCFFLGVCLFYFEIRFLTEFDFIPITKKIIHGNFKLAFAVALMFFGMCYLMFSAFTSVSDGEYSRMSALRAPVQGVIGYTYYILDIMIVTWSIPSTLTNIYVLFLRFKGETK